MIHLLIRVVKWAQNPIVLFAKLRKPQSQKLQKLRKLRIAISVFLRKLRVFILRFIICMDQLEFGKNDHREDASHFSFGSRRILSGSVLLFEHESNFKNSENLECSFD